MKIDKTSAVPIYFQLKTLIQEGISSGEYPVGMCLPSEREYCEEYGISRMTVRQAISDLVNEGLLRRERGKGTYVSQPKIEQGLQMLTSFTEDMKRRNMQPGTRLIHMITCPAKGRVARQLGIEDGDSVYEIKRLRLADDEPMAIETAYVPICYLPNFTEEKVASGSLYEVMRERGIEISHATQTLEASQAKVTEATILNIKNKASVLLIERTTCASGGQVVEFVKSVYRGDRYKFAIDLRS
ncbi:GntR family transcriptional regulator [Desulfosporosinus fructosivorans]